jgi:hypothetical protein
MGYITYSLHYGHGEVWSETRPFFDYNDMVRLTHKDFLDTITEKYGAEYVHIVSLYVNELGESAYMVDTYGVELRAV